MPTGLKTERTFCVVGIDPSATGTGVAAIDLEEGTLLSTKRLAVGGFGVERLHRIKVALSEWLFSLPPVLHVAMEGYGFNITDSQSHKLGEVGGVIKLLLYQELSAPANYPSFPAPSQVKKYATGKGTAKKEEMLKTVYRKWGVDLATSDEADAYACAQIARGVLKGSEVVYEKAVLQAMRNPAKNKAPLTWAEMPAPQRYEFAVDRRM